MSENKITFTLACPDDFYVDVRQLAEAEKLSRSEMVIALAKHGFENWPPENRGERGSQDFA